MGFMDGKKAAEQGKPIAPQGNKSSAEFEQEQKGHAAGSKK